MPSPSHFAKRILRYRPPLAPAAACCVATALIASILPPSPPAADPQDLGSAFDAPLPGKPEAEDLAAFLASARWGRSLAERREDALEKPPPAEEAVPSTAAINPQLARIGLFGVTVQAGRHAVLMALPDGRSARLHPGDALPDGRILVAVDGNSVTLRDATGGQAKLVLFPKASAAAAVADDAQIPTQPLAPTSEEEASS